MSPNFHPCVLGFWQTCDLFKPPQALDRSLGLDQLCQRNIIHQRIDMDKLGPLHLVGAVHVSDDLSGMFVETVRLTKKSDRLLGHAAVLACRPELRLGVPGCGGGSA